VTEDFPTPPLPDNTKIILETEEREEFFAAIVENKCLKEVICFECVVNINLMCNQSFLYSFYSFSVNKVLVKQN